MHEINLDWPLMANNILREDLDAVIELLSKDDPMLTQSNQVEAFEKDWSNWLGTKYSVFVNSGSSANLITMSALKEVYGSGEIIVPTLTWVSDIASVIQCGFKPVFVDVNPRTLGMIDKQVIERINNNTKAVFLTHVLGYNALTRLLLDELELQGIPLIEDVCESYGATFEGMKLGNFGLMSNFSFYYAHHMSTIEGGMISTNNKNFYEILCMFRSHGMVRESKSDDLKLDFHSKYPDLHPEFIFAFPAYNLRNTEINATIGRSQLKRLDGNNAIRTRNLQLFLSNLDSEKYFTNFEVNGSCNYALTLVLREPNDRLYQKVLTTLTKIGVEFRRGTAGGGNQLRQPYLKDIIAEGLTSEYPNIDHIHFYGLYIGNYPKLKSEKILQLCSILNGI